MSGMDKMTDAELFYWEHSGTPSERIMARELLAHRRASQAAPAPSDGLREAVRFGCDQLGMDKMPDGEWVRFTDYQALRERAEAAEAERDRQYDENVHRIAMQARAENERDAARRGEAAAWNDAIEAAAETMANGDLMEAPDHEPWFINRWRSVRALRRAAPTEGEA